MKKKQKSTFWQDFKKFISRGNVVDMAVGVTVASAFTAIVTAFTKGFISPLLALLTQDSDLSAMSWVLRYKLDETTNEWVPDVQIMWGSFLQSILDFLIIAFVLFLVLRIFTKVSKKAREMTEDAKKRAFAEERAAEEQKAKAEAEAKAAEDARIAAEEAEKERARLAEAEAAKDREQREIDLLTEIRDLLLKQQK